ncbi:MAG: SBBP repeat-containing protein, partial [Acidobacteriota bacterium]|nr:SBBP repeat-containing protein [Acidobacteriota bacterium]
AIQPSNHGGGNVTNAFVTKINASGTALVYSTYLGGSGGIQAGADGPVAVGDTAVGIAIDSAGNAYVGGDTPSTDFPTSNALQTANQGASSFVSKINASGTAFIYSTYMGGGVQGIAADNAGNAYVAGGDGPAAVFPTANTLQLTSQGNDVFVAKINPTGLALIYVAFFGGSGGDTVQGIGIDGAGNSYVAGFTRSTDFPTVGAARQQP